MFFAERNEMKVKFCSESILADTELIRKVTMCYNIPARNVIFGGNKYGGGAFPVMTDKKESDSGIYGSGLVPWPDVLF